MLFRSVLELMPVLLDMCTVMFSSNLTPLKPFNIVSALMCTASRAVKGFAEFNPNKYMLPKYQEKYGHVDWNHL